MTNTIGSGILTMKGVTRRQEPQFQVVLGKFSQQKHLKLQTLVAQTY